MRTQLSPLRPSAPVPQPVRLLQRCECGGMPGPTGECAACRRKRKCGLQPKPIFNRPRGHEQEADRVAEQVMRIPMSPLQRHAVLGKETASSSGIPAHGISADGGSGGPLPAILPRKSVGDAAVQRAPSANDLEDGPSAEAPSPAEGGAEACTPPTSVRLVRTHTLAFPGYRTGGGLCAVMEPLPAGSNLCQVPEAVAPTATGTTCPDTLVRGMCTGSSVFTPGRNQVRSCRDVEVPATGFIDRHTIQVRGISVLHDASRNPQDLDRCTSICHQRYYVQRGSTQTDVGRFQIRYDFSKGVRDGEDVTNVTAAKTALP
jgi:hypothetical protein